MKTTKAFDRDLQDFLDEMNAGDSFVKTKEDILQRIAEEAEYAVSGYMSIDYVNFNGDSEDRFDFKAFVDPYSSDREVVLAAEDEKVVEWVESFDDPVWQEALLPGNPEAHVVTYDPELNCENNTAYIALCNDGRGHVSTEKFDEMHFDEALRGACAFAWGLTMDEIEQAQEMSVGYIREEVAAVYPDYTAQGFVYKNAFAFMMKNDEICYISEHGFDNAEHWENEYVLSECEGYTYQDIVDICQGNEKVAELVFANIDWQGPGAYYEELEPEEIAEITAGVNLEDGYELLELQDCDLPVSVFYAHGGECLVADFRGDLDERTDLDEAIRAKSRVEFLRVIESPEQLEEIFMSESDVRALGSRMQDESWREELRAAPGPDMSLLTKGEFELRVQFVNRPEGDVYVFYMQSPYGVSGIRDLVDLPSYEPWSVDVAERIAEVWNKWSAAELYVGLPGFEPTQEIRFVSTTDVKVSAWTSIHNVMMQEKATFGVMSAAENGLNAAGDQAQGDGRGSREVEHEI